MNILDFVMVGSNDYEKSSEFYDVILEPLKLKKTLKTEKYIGYSHLGEPEKVIFYITNPVNGKPATFGNGTQITLLADSKEAVEKFYEIAISKGAVDEGGPGMRKDGNYYAKRRGLKLTHTISRTNVDNAEFTTTGSKLVWTSIF